MDLINLPKSNSIVKSDDFHKPIARGLFTLDGQIDIQAQNILEQFEVLKNQMIQIEENKKKSKKIYNSEIKFEPIIQGIYYLYIRNESVQFISMIAPNEWGRSQKSKLDYVATIQLDYDHTWKIINLNQKNYFDE